MTITPQNINEEQSRMQTIRQDYEPLKQLSTALSYPARSDQLDYYRCFDEIPGSPTTRSRKIYDSTAIKGLNTWGDGIVGYFMPSAQGSNWFKEQPVMKELRDSKRVRQWCQDNDEHLSYTLSRCNYYSEKLNKIKDSGCIGDGFLFVDNDVETGKLICLAPHPREFWIKRDYWGRPTKIHHAFNKSLRELADEFGEDKALSPEQKQSLEKNPDAQIQVIHAIYKNKDYEPTKPGIKNMKWQHYYLNVPAKKMMLESGSRTLNPVPWSLNRPSNEVYGRGVISQMLLDILTVNFMSKDLLIASQAAARPPMLMSSALKAKLDMGAGAVNFVGHREMAGVKAGDLVARLLDSSGYPFGAENLEKWRGIVEARLGVPLFEAMQRMALGGDYKNVPLVSGVQSEQAVLMAPFLITLCTDTDMELERVYQLEAENGRAPMPPQEVLDAQNGRTEMSYVGPLFQLLQRFYQTGNLLNTIQNIQAVLSVAPQARDIIDGDELMRKIMISGNAPEKLVLTAEDVQELRAIAAQHQEQMRQAELLAKSSKAVPNLSGAIDKDSVLSQLMGNKTAA